MLVDKYLEGKEIEVDAICDGERRADPGDHGARRARRRALGRHLRGLPGASTLPGRDRDASSSTRRGSRSGSACAACSTSSTWSTAASVYVLEVNPRVSPHGAVPVARSPGCRWSIWPRRSCSARRLREQGYGGGLWPRQPLVAVKAPVFSMSKLRGVDIYLGPEMKSTGEVMGVDHGLRAGLLQGADLGRAGDQAAAGRS